MGTEWIIAFIALAAMEIVLGIDNVVFIAILAGRLPEHQRAKARTIGLALALVTRILLLCTISWMLSMKEPFFHVSSLGIPADWLSEAANGVSVKDLILLVGGLFLIGKSVLEIHHKIEGHDHQKKAASHPGFASVIVQILVIDIVFSLDSVITAVGMAKDISVMIAAVIFATLVMLVFAGYVSAFVEKHPTVKMLALSFLILIGVMLVADAAGTHVDKGYIYFAMAFALGVEMLNLRMKVKLAPPVDAD